MILACHNLDKSFGDHVIVKSGSFHIEEREKAAFVGVNGAGKSTILKDRKYIEIGKVNEKAVICMDSAGYLQKLLKKEPEVISVATERTDRKKMEFAFPVNRYYFQNTGAEDEIELVNTEFGSYRVYSVDRTVCDCIRMKSRLSGNVLEEIEEAYKSQKRDINRLLAYAKSLRALKCIKERNL